MVSKKIKSKRRKSIKIKKRGGALLRSRLNDTQDMILNNLIDDVITNLKKANSLTFDKYYESVSVSLLSLRDYLKKDKRVLTLTVKKICDELKRKDETNHFYIIYLITNFFNNNIIDKYGKDTLQPFAKNIHTYLTRPSLNNNEQNNKKGLITFHNNDFMY